jgi:outer membrane protein assembly factor BamB
MNAKHLFATAALLALTAVACSAPVPSPQSVSDWPQFLGPARNGTSPETGLFETWTKKGPPVRWSVKVGEGYAGPVVAGKRVVLFHRVGNEEVIECFDTDKGESQWKFAYATKYVDRYGKGNGPRATPLISGGKVYTYGAEGMLSCVELESGKKVWQESLRSSYKMRDNFFGIGTSPLIEGDLLLVNVGAKDAGVVAFNKDTGKEVWKATDYDASYSSPVAATIDGVRHVIFFTREGLLSLDPANGKERFSKRWRARMAASVNAATPLVVGDEIFVTASYQTGALLVRAKKDGIEEIWSNDESLSSHYNTPVVRDGFLYGIDGRQEEGGRLRCVEWKSGKVRWTKEGFGCASLLLADGHLIALTEEGELVLIEATPEAYREKARVGGLAAVCRAPLALSDGKLYGRDAKQLHCWDLKK